MFKQLFGQNMMNKMVISILCIECPGNGDIGECECDGQLWINDDCRLVKRLNLNIILIFVQIYRVTHTE